MRLHRSVDDRLSKDPSCTHGTTTRIRTSDQLAEEFQIQEASFYQKGLKMAGVRSQDDETE